MSLGYLDIESLKRRGVLLTKDFEIVDTVFWANRLWVIIKICAWMLGLGGNPFDMTVIADRICAEAKKTRDGQTLVNSKGLLKALKERVDRTPSTPNMRSYSRRLARAISTVDALKPPPAQVLPSEPPVRKGPFPDPPKRSIATPQATGSSASIGLQPDQKSDPASSPSNYERLCAERRALGDKFPGLPGFDGGRNGRPDPKPSAPPRKSL
jgi:hypothetical protein